MATSFKSDANLLAPSATVKTRRGYGRKSRKINLHDMPQTLSLVGNNAAGLNLKKESLLNLVNAVHPSIITLQETKFTQYGSFKIAGYEIFECLRTKKLGGGLFTAALVSLDPVEITRDEQTEILVIEISIRIYRIRIINGYGPQEDENSQAKSFWHSIETEVIKAKDQGCGIIIQLDANAKVGSNILKNDPNAMSSNGHMLFNFIERQGLILGNALPICKGSITRERKVDNYIEKAILDYIILCETMKNYVVVIKIDEECLHALKHSTIKKNNDTYIYSDHNVVICKFSIQFHSIKRKDRQEFFDFRNEGDKLHFKRETNVPGALSSWFNSECFMPSCTFFFRHLKKICFKCFHKIRIRDEPKKLKGDKITQTILDVQKKLKLMLNSANVVNCSVSKHMVLAFNKSLEVKLNRTVAEDNVEKVKNFVQTLKDDIKLNHTGFWKLKKKLCPRRQDPPSAKRDSNGNLVTAKSGLQNLYLETYQARLSHRPMKAEYSDIYQLKMQLWASRMIQLSEVKTDAWTTLQLRNALARLKRKKSS